MSAIHFEINQNKEAQIKMKQQSTKKSHTHTHTDFHLIIIKQSFSAFFSPLQNGMEVIVCRLKQIFSANNK